MIVTLKNQTMTAQIDSIGAQLVSTVRYRPGKNSKITSWSLSRKKPLGITPMT